MKNCTQVFLVDDHTLVRSGIRMLLEKEHSIRVIGEAGDARSAIDQIVSSTPDIVLLDISLPDMDGVELTRTVCATIPSVRVIALTMHLEEVYLSDFLQAGGVGYVHKSAADRDLIYAINTVMNGQIFLRPEGVQLIARQHQGKTTNGEVTPEVLSKREMQVLRLVAKGYTCREIGEFLSLSPRTVETYRERITDKLELERRSQLVEYVLRHHLLEEPVG